MIYDYEYNECNLNMQYAIPTLVFEIRNMKWSDTTWLYVIYHHLILIILVLFDTGIIVLNAYVYKCVSNDNINNHDWWLLDYDDRDWWSSWFIIMRFVDYWLSSLMMIIDGDWMMMIIDWLWSWLPKVSMILMIIMLIDSLLSMMVIMDEDWLIHDWLMMITDNHEWWWFDGDVCRNLGDAMDSDDDYGYNWLLMIDSWS